MTPLVRKELRDQRPFVVLGLFFFALEIVDDLFDLDPLRQTLASTFIKKFELTGDLSIFTSLVAFAVGAGLLVREQDDRTLEFLESLPVTRARIFGTKVLVALGVALLYPVLDTLYLFLCHGLASTSLDRSLHLDLLAIGLMIRLPQALMLLALALALSHFRRLTWLLLGVTFVAFSRARQRIPSLELLNPYALTVPSFDGRHWRIPWETLGAQLLVGGALLGVSLVLFLGLGERLLRAIQARLTGTALGGLATLATVGVVLYWAYLWDKGSSDGDNAAPKGTALAYTFDEGPPAHTQTARYQFTYASNQSERAEALIRRADETFETVRRFLKTEPGELISVDMTGSARHTLGTARWSSVQMELLPEAREGENLATLGHETTHVLARRLAGLDAEATYKQFGTFHEGLATYVETHFFHPLEPRADRELVAAAMWARHEVKLEELIDTSLLARRRDEDLEYPLGLLWVEAMVKRYGEDAPVKLLKAIGRKDAPEGLEAPERWQETYQAAGFDLDEVAETFQAELERLSKARAKEIAALPRPRGAAEAEADNLVVRPKLDTTIPEGWSVVCRFRVYEEDSRSDIDGPYDATAGCRRAKRLIAQKRLWYQLGLRSPFGHTLYEPWVSAPVD